MKTLLKLSVTLGCFLLLAPFAHALTDTPLDCPGVIAVKNGYRLTQDTTCAGFYWDEDNKTFNLNGFTLTTGSPSRRVSIVIEGTGQTIRNGILQPQGINWAFSHKIKFSNVWIKGDKADYIEAAGDSTIENCRFTNFSSTALVFYYRGGSGVVKNSKFIGNGTGLSIQKPSGILIENNMFIGNGRGVNLFNEDDSGVNNNMIRDNTFRRNGIGINMLALWFGGGLFPTMDGNKFLRNKISQSRHSGIFIKVVSNRADLIPAQNTFISGNRMTRNGFQPSTGLPYAGLPVGVEPNDDGITARAYVATSFGQYIETPYPEGLAGVTLSNNRADRNADLGFDVEGITDGGGQVANRNGNPAECIGIVCTSDIIDTAIAESSIIPFEPLTLFQGEISGKSFEIGQLRHKKRSLILENP